MTRYLLDTDVLIDFSKGIESVTETVLSWIDGVDTVALCAISVAEFHAGLNAEQSRAMGPFLDALIYWDISRQVAQRAGAARYDLARAGTTVTITDALLAALALEHDATLVTSNLKDYPMQDLRLRSIR